LITSAVQGPTFPLGAASPPCMQGNDAEFVKCRVWIWPLDFTYGMHAANNTSAAVQLRTAAMMCSAGDQGVLPTAACVKAAKP